MISRRVGRYILEMPNDDREPLYDFMKGILIIMVLLNHVINQYGFNVLNENNDYIRPLIFMVNMPSFFIIAGYFCPTSLSKYGVKQYCIEKVKRLLWPLVVFFATPKYQKMQNAFPKVAAGNSSFLHVSPA